MVVLFATVVFTGSILNGTRDRVVNLFAKSIKTEKDSASNTSTISANPYEKKKESSGSTSIFSKQPKKTAPTQTRYFQVQSRHGDTLRSRLIKCDSDQAGGNKDLSETNQEGKKTIPSEDHGIKEDETKSIRDKIQKSGNTVDLEKDENSGSDERKLNALLYQGCTFQRSQLRQRRKGPKTLKKELEEAGILISENGETDIKSEKEQQQAENPLRGQSIKVTGDMQHGDQYIEFASEVNGCSGNLSSSHDDLSFTGDELIVNKPHEADDFNETTSCFPVEDITSHEDVAVPSPVVVERKMDGKPPRIFEEQGEGCSSDGENKEFEVASDGASNDTNADIYKAELLHEHMPDNGRSNRDYLSFPERKDALPVDAGDKKQNQIENQHGEQDTISETGDFGRPRECDHEGSSAANVDSGRVTRVKHRSQKGVEDRLQLHRNIQPGNDGTITKENVLEGNGHPPKIQYEHDTKPSAVLHIQPTRNNSTANESIASSVDRNSNIQYRDHSVLARILGPEDNPVDFTDKLDLVVDRFNDSGVCLDEQQNSSQIDELSEEDKEQQQSGEEHYNHIYFGSLQNDFDSSSVDSHDVNRQEEPTTPLSHDDKKELKIFLEDFDAFDRVHSYWNHEHYQDENNLYPSRGNDTIVMTVENRDRHPRKMERLHLKDRIALATCHLAAIRRDMKKEEDRLLKLVQEIGDARQASEKSKRELLKEQKIYRELLIDYCKVQEDTKAIDTRCRTVEIELLVLRRRKWKTDMMLNAATAEVNLLDHRLKKEQTLQEEQKERRLGSKRRRFQRTTLKVNALAILVILQVILLIIALWYL